MAREIERKFLIRGDGWRRQAGTGTSYHQGYLTTRTALTVRVRLAGGKGFLTVKGADTGFTRLEFEYEIPPGDATEMLDRFCTGGRVDKTRYRIAFAGLIWEVDEFHGENQGLLLAEVELDREDQAIEIPPWAGLEVTSDPRYHNAYLAQKPFTSW